jgi:pimeloyl-ACP methyl ester carboxylesterase
VESDTKRALRVTVTACLLCLLGCEGERKVGDNVSLVTEIFEAGGREIEVERGTLRVPLDRRERSSSQISLQFVLFPSTSRRPAAPIVYLAGGPGGSGIDAAAGERYKMFRELTAVADVIAFDQRGTGRSDPEEMFCENSAPAPLDRPLDPDDYVRMARDRVNACVEQMARREIDLGAFTSLDSADDLEDLRIGLGAKKLTLLGISYGTHLALATARRHPDSIDKLILAGVEGPDHTFKLPANIQANLERLADLVAQDPQFAEKMPDLLGTLAEVLDKLDRKPVEVELLAGQTVVVGKWDLQKRIAVQMGSRFGMQRLPAAIYAMSNGEFLDLARWAVGFRQAGRTLAMSVAMDCASYGTAGRLEEIERQAEEALLGAAIDFPVPGICEGTGLPRLEDGFRAGLETDIPTLLISGTLDGRTPPTNAEEVARDLSNYHHLVIERAAHSDDLFLSSEKIIEAIVAFAKDDPVPYRTIDGPQWKFSPPFAKSFEIEVVRLLDALEYDEAVRRYETLRKEHEGDGTYDFSENVLNVLGYDLLQAGETELAILVFRLNTEAYPEAFNTWDSLGEGYMVAGNKSLAIEYYERSLALNPENSNAERMLAKLRDENPEP